VIRPVSGGLDNCQIRHHAVTVFVLPVTCQNSNIACLIWGTDIHRQMLVLARMRTHLFRAIFTRSARVIPVLAIALTLGACAASENCDEVQFYEVAELGKRIDVPDDLDNITGQREMVIPEASPRPPREPGTCLDRPPTLRTGETEKEKEAETES